MPYSNLIKKDDNSVSVLCGIADDTGAPIALQIDHVTGRMLAEIYIVSDSSPVPVNLSKDANSVSTMACQSDNSSTIYTPVVDHRNSNLYADILAE